jgi:predicted DNA-binding transcriptional regulator YafY
MAISKHPFGRYQIIDRELCRKEWVKTKELKQIIENELSVNISERTINEDIKAMTDDSLLGYFAPIEYNNVEKAYYYTDDNYTIKAFGLKEGDINALMFYAKTINQYKEYEVFKDFTNAIDKIIDAVNIRKGITSIKQAKTVVQTEITPKVIGSELIPIIVQALNSNKILEFQYHKFEESKFKIVKLAPHLLKEDRHRWYIIGKVNELSQPTKTYALDRIKCLNILEDNFEPIDFDFEEYYKYSFGITVTDDEPIEVILSFTRFQGNYLKTLKVHHSQKTLIDDEEEYRISITVKPTWEFYEKILGYGDTVKVISPENIINEIRDKIDFISKQYQ